jgi:hypothetical protein
MISAILMAGMLLADTTAALQTTPDATTPAAKPTATAHTASQATAPAAKKDNPMALVCRSEPVLGSRLPVKRCRTQGDVETEKLESRQALERSQILTDSGH